LGDTLVAEAPAVGSIFSQTERLGKASNDGQIIYQHARLMASAQALDIALVMAMPPHEREARFISVRVVGILKEDDRAAVLKAQGLDRLAGNTDVFVLKMHQRSRDAKMKEGDYNWSFLPEAAIAELQNLTVAQFIKRNEHRFPEGRRPQVNQWDWHKPLRTALSISIRKIDRPGLIIVAEVSELLANAVRHNVIKFDFSDRSFAILDPFHVDYFVNPKLKPALMAIANPPLALSRPLFLNPRVAKVAAPKRRMNYPDVPAGSFVWNADVMAFEEAETLAACGEIVAEARRELTAATPAQIAAITSSASRRLCLWWGPPGSGKSATAAALLRGLLKNGMAGSPIRRIAITGPTWVSIDNVAAKLPRMIEAIGGGGSIKLARLLSKNQSKASVQESLRPFVLSVDDEAGMQALGVALNRRQEVVIVASTVDQIWKIGGDGLQPLFDFLLIDESSQMDVAHAIVAFTKLTGNASVTVVGDDKQMSPIHPVEPPVGAEHLLGSLYNFYRQYGRDRTNRQSIDPVMLDTSFRSNQEIIEFVREAGYGPKFKASEKNRALRITFEKAVTDERPDNWPDRLPWSQSFGAIIDPERPLVAIVHPDRTSSQRNDAEADIVAGLVVTMWSHGLMDLRRSDTRYDGKTFFLDGVGIVTPHRAQQSAILDRLGNSMPTEVDRDALYNAVDTVERFQGQEKAVMIASFGLGDSDQIGAEEEFLYSLNRFNVIASRAKAKLIVIMSRRLVDYLPCDPKALEESRLLKHYADGFLRKCETVWLPGFTEPCDLKFR
jgi:hypothetical protein